MDRYRGAGRKPDVNTVAASAMTALLTATLAQRTNDEALIGEIPFIGLVETANA